MLIIRWTPTFNDAHTTSGASRDQKKSSAKHEDFLRSAATEKSVDAWQYAKNCYDYK